MLMTVLKALVAFALGLVVVFFLGAHLLPDRVELERGIDIERPQSQVFAIVNDLRRFNDWSPWYPLDPEADYQFEGPASGVGALMRWQGNDQVRSGTMAITESRAPDSVVTHVVFGEPGTEPAVAQFAVEAIDEVRSRVTWTFALELKGALARWFGLMMPRYVGADYEAGLARLKQLAESESLHDFSDLELSEQVLNALDVIAMEGSAPAGDAGAIAAELGRRYGELIEFAGRNGLELTGHPLTLTQTPDPQTWRFQAALPVRFSGAVTPEHGIELLRTHAGAALVVEHIGPYEQLPGKRQRLEEYAQAHGYQRAGPLQEVYVSDPADTPPEQLLTRIFYPLQP